MSIFKRVKDLYQELVPEVKKGGRQALVYGLNKLATALSPTPEVHQSVHQSPKYGVASSDSSTTDAPIRVIVDDHVPNSTLATFIEVMDNSPGTIKADSSTEDKKSDVKYSLEDLIPEWVPLSKIRAITGRDSTSFYKAGVFDYKGGPIKTKKDGRDVLVEKNSLITYTRKNIGEFRMYTIEEAAEVWEGVAMAYGDARRKAGCINSLIDKKILVPTLVQSSDEPIMAFSNIEFTRVLVPYVAKKEINLVESPSVDYRTAARILGLTQRYISNLVHDKRLRKYKSTRKVSVNSIKQFLKKNEYHSSGKWCPINSQEE